MTRVVRGGLAAGLLAVATAGVPAASAALPHVTCSGTPASVRTLVMNPTDPTYNGLYAVPRRSPNGLVVFAHGHGHTPNAWRDILVRTATNDGVIAVAMEYPHSEILGYDSQHGWRVQEGADNSIAAAQLFERSCKKLETIVDYGVSMGGNTSGLMAAAGAKRRNGKPLFDLWFNIEGVTNLIEEYLGARALANGTGNADAALAVSEIEQETGGPIEQVPAEYQKRTVVLRATDIRNAGIRGVVMAHAVDDGLVPYNQSREMFGRLMQNGIPTTLYTIGSAGGTPTGTTLDGLLGAPQPSPFVGHGFEGDQTHLVIKTGLDHLDAILQGREPFPSGFHDQFVDGSAGGPYGP